MAPKRFDAPSASLRLTRPEDLVLAGWLLIVVPALAVVVGTPALDLGADPSPGTGLLFLVAAGGALVGLLTRSSRETAPGPRTVMTPYDFARFPMMAAIGLFAEEGAQGLGLPFASGLFPLAVGAAFAGWMFQGRLPILAMEVRRVMVMPLILVGSGIFEGMADEIWAGITPAAITSGLAGTGGVEASYVAFILGLLLAGTLAFYALFVFAPRQAIEPEGGWLAWAFRFAIFMVSMGLGIGWLRTLG